MIILVHKEYETVELFTTKKALALFMKNEHLEFQSYINPETKKREISEFTLVDSNFPDEDSLWSVHSKVWKNNKGGL